MVIIESYLKQVFKELVVELQLASLEVNEEKKYSICW